MFDRSPAPPRARGALSSALLTRLRGAPGPIGPLPPGDDPLVGEDFHLALYAIYELHYRGLRGVDPAWEWHPELVRVVRDLETRYETALRHDVGPLPKVAPQEMALGLRELLEGVPASPSVSGFMATEGTLAHLREFAVHRSPYQRKEADPHTWAIPRLSGRTKAAIVEIQSDEYGGGRPGEAHADLFGETMVALGLDPTYGAYVDDVPGITLATTNLITFFGLHRRLRGALVGHLAAFEMTSVGPMSRYAAAFRRLGVGGHEFYDVHVEADAHHEVVAAHDLAQGLAMDEPALAGEIIFGALAVTNAERRLARHLMACWEAGVSSLRSAGAELALSA